MFKLSKLFISVLLLSISVLAQAASVQLTWTAVIGASGYNVYRSNTCFSNGPYTKLNNSPVVAPAYTDTTAQSSTVYCYTATTVVTGTNAGITTTLESNKSSEAVAIGSPKITTVIVTVP